MSETEQRLIREIGAIASPEVGDLAVYIQQTQPRAARKLRGLKRLIVRNAEVRRSQFDFCTLWINGSLCLLSHLENDDFTSGEAVAQ
jgi:hypothetical protein